MMRLAPMVRITEAGGGPAFHLFRVNTVSILRSRECGLQHRVPGPECVSTTSSAACESPAGTGVNEAYMATGSFPQINEKTVAFQVSARQET
jgi:hypothetical protein